jgi:hypothetical protein
VRQGLPRLAALGITLWPQQTQLRGEGQNQFAVELFPSASLETAWQKHIPETGTNEPAHREPYRFK